MVDFVVQDNLIGTPGDLIAGRIPDMGPAGSQWISSSGANQIAPSGQGYQFNYFGPFSTGRLDVPTPPGPENAIRTIDCQFNIDLAGNTPNVNFAVFQVDFNDGGNSWQIDIETINLDAASFTCNYRYNYGDGITIVGTEILAWGQYTFRFTVDTFIDELKWFRDGVEKFSEVITPFAPMTDAHRFLFRNLGTYTGVGQPANQPVLLDIAALLNEPEPIVTTSYEYSPVIAMANFSRPINPFGIPRPAKI